MYAPFFIQTIICTIDSFHCIGDGLVFDDVALYQVIDQLGIGRA